MTSKLNIDPNIDLVFIDIEATDDSKNREMIQFSAIKVKPNGKTEELDLLINPEQELSTYIINLLKIDNEYLSQMPTINKVKQQIIDFLSNTLIVTFGEWDYKFLLEKIGEDLKTLMYQEYTHLDLQLFFKQFSKNQLPLLQLHNFLFSQQENYELQHYAMIDALMLKDIFYEIRTWDETKFNEIIPYIRLMPRLAYPSHKIFQKHELLNKWTNKIQYPFLFVPWIDVGQFIKKEKNKKQTIHYIKSILVCNNLGQKQLLFINPYKEMGEFLYEEYLREYKRFAEKFLKICANSSLIFKKTSKDHAQFFCETIYDATKQYCLLNYINLAIFSKKSHDTQKEDNVTVILNFNEMIKKLPSDKKLKFQGYYEND